MIHAIVNEMNAILKANGCPFRITDDSIRPETSWGGERVIVNYDQNGDAFSPPTGLHRNPKMYLIRSVAAKFRIYAQDPKAGAMSFEHKIRCEKILDQVLCALHEVTVPRRQPYQIVSGKWVIIQDLEGSVFEGGAIYDLTVRIARGVLRTRWDDGIQSEAILEAIETEVGTPT